MDSPAAPGGREVADALSGAPATEAVAEVVPPPATPAVAPAAGKTEGPGLSGSLMRYWRYVEALGLEGASLDELVAGPPADPGAAAPAEPAEPAAPVPVAQVEQEIIPITALCYSGPAALERAISLRDQVTSAIASGVDAADLIEEVFDLVQLGLATDR